MAAKKESYEASMERLEAIVEQIENGELNIDQLSANLKEAKQLLAFCKKRLFEVDGEIKELLQADTEA